MALTPFISPGVAQLRLSTMAAHQRKVRRIQAVVTPTIAYDAAQLASYNPRLDAGVVGGLSMAGVTPDDPVMELVSERAAYQESSSSLKHFGKDGGILGEWVWNPFKGMIRGAMMGLEGAMQEAESLLVRTPVGMAQGLSLGEAFTKAGRSDAWHALDGMLSGKRVHTGTGFFATDQENDNVYIQSELAKGKTLAEVVGSQEYAAQFQDVGIDVAQQGEMERSRMQITHGASGKQTPVSLGRLAAIQVAEPGTQGFHYLSGIIDAGKQLILDPADLALGGAGKAMKLRKLLYTPQQLANPNLASKAMQGLKAGLIPNAHRKTLLARTVDEYFDLDPTGQGVIKYLTEEDSPTAVYRLLGRSQKRNVDGQLARTIAEETDIDEVRNILKAAYGPEGGLREAVKGPGGTRKFLDKNIRTTTLGTHMGRMAAVTNSKVIDVHNRIDAVAQVDNYLTNLGLPMTKHTELLDRALRIEDAGLGLLTDQDLYSQYFEIVKDATDTWVAGLNMPAGSPLKAAMTRLFDSEDAFRSFWIDNLGDDVMFGGARFSTGMDGKMVANPSAVMFSQFLNQAIPLPDARKIRAAINKSFLGQVGQDSKSLGWLRTKFGSDDWNKVGNHAVVNSLDWLMSNVWKPSVLLRVAWPVRVIGEEQIRLGGKLMAGAFNHPLQYMALMANHNSKALGKFARMSDDVLGRSMMDDAAFEASMSTHLPNTAEALLGKKAGIGGAGARFEAVLASDLNDDDFLQALVFQLNQPIKDDLHRQVALAIHEELIEAGDVTPSVLKAVKDRVWNGDLQYLRKRMLRDSGRWGELNSRTFSDMYVDTLYGHGTHMGGGDGFLVDYNTLQWHNFSGETLGPVEVRKRLGLGTADLGAKQLAIGDSDYDRAFPLIRDRLRAAFGPDEGNQRLGAVEEFYEDIIEQGVHEFEAMDETIQYANTLIEEGADASLAAGRDLEFIPAWEYQQGVGELAESRLPYDRMHQTIAQGQLDKANITQHLETAFHDLMMDPTREITDAATGRLLYAEDLNTSGPVNIQLNDFEDPGEELLERTFVHKPDGDKPFTAIITTLVDPDTGKAVGVAYVGGLDGADLKKLADDIIGSKHMTYEDLINFSSDGAPFRSWLKQEGLLPEGGTEADFWKMFEENPDLLRKFYSREPKPNEFGYVIGFKSGKNPRNPRTSTTRMGAEFQRQALRQGREAAQEMPQHTEFFKVERAGDPRIWELMGTGKITDDAGETVLDWGTERATTNKGIRDQFEARKAFFREDIDHWRQTAPTYLRRPVAMPGAKDIRRWDEGVNVMMQLLMSKPTDYLSRSPAFRQFYWQRAGEMASYLDEADRGRLLTAAEKANVLEGKDLASKAGGMMRRLRRSTGRENVVDEAMRYINDLAGSPAVIEEGAINTLEQLDEVAKAYAMEEVKQLLYDQSKRHNFTDSMRLIMPFGEAWFEVVSTWAKLMKENPRNIRRIQQGVQGARGANPFRDVGPDGEQGRGFFFNDPNSGEEIFAYPGMGLIPDWMPWIGGAGEVENLELTGRVSGLNLMGQIMPGIGPVLQVPLSQIGYFDDVENPNRALRDIIMPFGKSEFDVTDPATWLSPVLPRWVNKGLQAWGQGSEGNQRLYANTVIDVYKTLLMQGWSDDSPEDMSATLKEARRLAGDIARVRALASFAAPAGTTMLWEVTYDPQDKEGDVWAYSNLATAYRQVLDEYQGDEVQAFKQFQDLFGLDPMLFTVAKTQKVLPRAVTLEARAWEQNNKDLFAPEAYPLTAFYAKPDPPEGEFDYETYLLQLENDTRQPLTPEQWALKRNQFVGRISYANFQRQADRRFDDQAQKTLWLRNAHSSLQVLFPGYGQPIVGLPARPGLDAQIDELYSWSGDERLDKSESGIALALYLRYRDQVINLTQTRLGYTSDTGFRTGKLSTMYRRQLRGQGMSLVEQYPEFLSLWQQILSRELEEPEATMSPVNIAGVGF